MRKNRALHFVTSLALGTSLLAGSAFSVFAEEAESTMPENYNEDSAAIYEAQLGEFYDYYMQGKEEVDNVSRRYALMAIAEAKLMESAVMLPLESGGGNYALSRIVPYTAPEGLWGADSYREQKMLVATEFIKAADRDELKAYYNQHKGDGTYWQYAYDYLTEKGYEIGDVYNYAYTSDNQTWDVVNSSRAVDTRPLTKLYEGLLQYDCEGVEQPALAESYTVSEDGLVYTFKIREGCVWVDSQGRKVADVTADDFVAGFQHMMDTNSGLGALTYGVIANSLQYDSGEVDFDQVGVKAVDTYTLEYTLESKCPWFTSMLHYSTYAPVNRAYYESQGGKFGADFDSSAEDYTYGLSPDNIAYCGPYVVTNATEKNTIVFQANESYWDAENVVLKTINWLYNDGSDTTKGYHDAVDGTISGVGLNSSTVELAKADGYFDEYAYVAVTDSTSYMMFYNLNRQSFANVNDPTIAVSPQDEATQERTAAAMSNVHFRRALATSLDRGSYFAQVVGEDLKYGAIRNTYVPGDFVSLTEDVTIDDVTYTAGTKFGAIVQAQLDADGVGIQVWDPEGNNGAGSTDYFDGWYQPEYAASELAVAAEELAAEGVTIDAENPIYLDLPYWAGNENYANRGNAYKQSIESTLGGQVIINLVPCDSAQDWYYTGYYTEYGYENNYNITDVSGWAPDFGDPCSYLDTFLPDYDGYMAKSLGIF